MSVMKREHKTAIKTKTLPLGKMTLALNSPFSRQLEERIDILNLLGNSPVRDEAISDFLHHFEYLQEEYIRPLFEEEGDVYFTPEYVITSDDHEHPDHYGMIRLMASMIEQCQPEKSPNLTEEDMSQMRHISGR